MIFYKQNSTKSNLFGIGYDRSVLEGNIHTEININNRIAFDDKDIIKWDWGKTNIMIESQTENLGIIWHKNLENLYYVNSLLILSSPKAHRWWDFS